MSISDKRMNKKMYEALHSDFGLKLEWLGKSSKDGDKTYTITGLNPRFKKFPVLATKTTSRNPHSREVLLSAPYVVALMTNSLEKYEKQQKDASQKKDALMLKEARKNFALAENYGIPKTWLDQTFQYGRKTYTIVGFNGVRKHPIVTQTDNGKIWFFDADYTKKLLGKQAA